MDKSNPNSKTENKDLSLFLAGDVMIGRGIDQILPNSVDPVLYESFIKNAKDYVSLAEKASGPLPSAVLYEYVWGDGVSELQGINPDVRIINLETAITTNDKPWPGKEIHYRMHPANAEVLTKAGIDICMLGNNHTMDWGIEGLRETLHVLKSQKIKACGGGLDADSAAAPVKINTDKGRLLVFSYASPSSGTPRDWQAKKNKPGLNFLDQLGITGAKKALEDIKLHRSKNDRVIISIHWGRNWGYLTPKDQRRFAHYLIDKDAADVIYGHSSHHPKRIEVYKNRLILYGCGDLINDYEGISGHDEYRGELSIMYFPILKPSGELKSLRMLPMKIHRFQLTKAHGDDVEWLTTQLNRTCERFGTSVQKSDNGKLFLKWNGMNRKNRLRDFF